MEYIVFNPNVLPPGSGSVDGINCGFLRQTDGTAIPLMHMESLTSGSTNPHSGSNFTILDNFPLSASVDNALASPFTTGSVSSSISYQTATGSWVGYTLQNNAGSGANIMFRSGSDITLNSYKQSADDVWVLTPTTPSNITTDHAFIGDNSGSVVGDLVRVSAIVTGSSANLWEITAQPNTGSFLYGGVIV
tara:strand:- start:1628 stop:2200 length:573 start_codon:yes stop_codon:yes gene_type:complete